RDHFALVGRDRPNLPVGPRLEDVLHDLDRLDALVTENRDRGDLEAKAERLRLALGLAHRELPEDLDVAARALAVLLERGLACRVELELGRVDDGVGTGELAELLQLGRREGRLRDRKSVV